MAKIKLTKNELKQQRDALKRFQRYLPTLQLKKQQLQVEVRHVREVLARLAADEQALAAGVRRWVAVLEETAKGLLESLQQVREWRVGTRNVAGIDTPVFESLSFEPVVPDLFLSPPWIEGAAQVVRQHVELHLRRRLA